MYSHGPAIRPYPESDDPVHTSHPIPLRSILILSSHLCPGLLSGIIPSGFPTKILYAFLISPMYAISPTTSELV